MNKNYVGIDNGVSGTIAIIKNNGDVTFQKMPVVKELSYTKKKQHITRINFTELYTILSSLDDYNSSYVLVERPMVNPGRFKATVSALRSLEATLIVLELLKMPYGYMDSRNWQKELLPSGLMGDELKKASLNIGNRIFPQFKEFKHPDRDGLLLAEYCRRHF